MLTFSISLVGDLTTTRCAYTSLTDSTRISHHVRTYCSRYRSSL